MLKSFQKVSSALKQENNILNPLATLQQQLRTTFILKRKNAPFLHKKNSNPKPLKSRHFVYELVRNEDVQKQPDLEVILVKYVEGLGNIGDIVSVRPNYAYNNLLLPGLAVYVTPENKKKYENYQNKEEEKHSSRYAEITANCLSKMTLSVVMNKETPWTLKPWHIRVSFRKCGYHVPEEAITMPKKPIAGPDMSIESKEFYITVTINNLETTNVRCRIHHWSTDITERLPHQHEFWKAPIQPIFPEDAPILSNLPSVLTVHEDSSAATTETA